MKKSIETLATTIRDTMSNAARSANDVAMMRQKIAIEIRELDLSKPAGVANLSAIINSLKETARDLVENGLAITEKADPTSPTGFKVIVHKNIRDFSLYNSTMKLTVRAGVEALGYGLKTHKDGTIAVSLLPEEPNKAGDGGDGGNTEDGGDGGNTEDGGDGGNTKPIQSDTQLADWMLEKLRAMVTAGEKTAADIDMSEVAFQTLCIDTMQQFVDAAKLSSGEYILKNGEIVPAPAKRRRAKKAAK